MRWATRIFHSTSRAWPSSSMSRQMTAAPYSRASVNTRSSAGPCAVAVLEVGRVEDGPAADPLEAGLHHLGLGGVEHERERSTWVAKRRAISSMSAAPSRPT